MPGTYAPSRLKLQPAFLGFGVLIFTAQRNIPGILTGKLGLYSHGSLDSVRLAAWNFPQAYDTQAKVLLLVVAVNINRSPVNVKINFSYQPAPACQCYIVTHQILSHI